MLKSRCVIFLINVRFTRCPNSTASEQSVKYEIKLFTLRHYKIRRQDVEPLAAWSGVTIFLCSFSTFSINTVYLLNNMAITLAMDTNNVCIINTGK